MGRRPEVFGELGPEKLLVPGAAEMPPSSANEVCAMLKDAFRQLPNDNSGRTETEDAVANEDMFAALRRTNKLSAIFYPRLESSVPSNLPIFDFSGSALLPQEQASFNFFEPRYREMAREITSDEGSGFFLLRGYAPSPLDDGVFGATVLLRIVKHQKLIDGQFQCIVQAGPRVHIIQDDVQQIEGCEPLARATEFELLADKDYEEAAAFNLDHSKVNESLQALRLHCLYLLVKAYNLEYITQDCLPPLDPERFSFWALKFVVQPADTMGRINWLASHSTQARLQHIIDIFEESLRILMRDGEKSNNV